MILLMADVQDKAWGRKDSYAGFDSNKAGDAVRAQMNQKDPAIVGKIKSFFGVSESGSAGAMARRKAQLDSGYGS